MADEAKVASTVASGLHLEYREGAPTEVDEAVTRLLPEDFCRKYGVAPLSLQGRALKVAVLDPLDYSAVQAVEFRTGKSVIAVVVTQTWFEALLSRRSQKPGRPAEAVAERTATYDNLLTGEPAGEIEAVIEAEVDLSSLVHETPVVKLVNLVLSDAARAGASDVHIEPHEKDLHVRQRVDGLLRDVLTIPRHMQDAAISRLKIMAGMDIAERRKPQDGRSRLRFEGVWAAVPRIAPRLHRAAGPPRPTGPRRRPLD
jgi:type IV pilus assembly protein PilB